MSLETPLEPAPHQPVPPARTNAGKGLGIAALVTAIVALTLCWVPIVNYFAAFLGFVALILGVISLVIAAKGRGSKGIGITSSVIAIVAIVMVFVTQAAYGKAIDGMSAAIEDAADGEMAAPEKVIEQAADESQVLKIGEAASIGECSVNVSAVNLDAGAVIAKANTFNDKAEGQYVFVGLSVVHKGEAEGDSWLDLSPELVGSDARIYNTTSSMAVAPKPATDVPTLTNGGKGVYQVISDVPAEAVTAAKVRVSESLSVNDEAGLWATK